MDGYRSFDEFLATHSEQIPTVIFVVNMVLAAILAWILGYVYMRYGTSLSNRRRLARNFVMLAMTTMLIITIVKSSLALSLGLVGALSIVRFRSAIKEPEELMYLFLCIAIGLGMGADQRTVTLLGFLIIVVVIWLNARSQRKDQNQNMQVTVSSESTDRIGLDSVLTTLAKYCTTVALKRLDETERFFEASLIVDFPNVKKLEECMNELRTIDKLLTFNFLDNREM